MNKLRKALVAVFTALFLVCSALFAVACNSNTADVEPEVPGSEAEVPSTPVEPEVPGSDTEGPSTPDEPQVYRVSVADFDESMGECTLSPANSGEGYLEGSSVTVTVTPKEGYRASLKVNGAPVDLDNGTYTFAVTQDTEVDVEYTWIYKVNANVTKGEGTIEVAEPKDGVKYQPGETVLVTLKPADGYAVGSLKLNGKTVKLEGSDQYTLTIGKDVLGEDVPSEGIWLAAEFLKVYNVTVSAYDSNAYTLTVNGTAYSGTELTVVEGKNVTLTVTAKENYELVSVFLNNGLTVLDENGSITFVASKDVEVYVRTVQLVEVTATVGEGSGTAVLDKVAEDNRYAVGTTLRLTVTADKYYLIESIKVNGVAVEWADLEDRVAIAEGKYTSVVYVFTVTGMTGIDVDFVANKFEVTAVSNNDARGTVKINDAADNNMYEGGTTLTIVATPAGGYVLGELTVNNSHVSLGDYKYGEYTFEYTVEANAELFFKFEKAPACAVTLEDGGTGATLCDEYGVDLDLSKAYLGQTVVLKVEATQGKITTVAINDGEPTPVFGGEYTFVLSEKAMKISVTQEEGATLNNTFNPTVGTAEAKSAEYTAQGSAPTLAVTEEGKLSFDGSEVALAEIENDTVYAFEAGKTVYTMQWYNGLVGGILMVTEGAPEAQPAAIMLLAAPQTYYYYLFTEDSKTVPQGTGMYWLQDQNVLSLSGDKLVLGELDGATIQESVTATLVAIVTETTESGETTHYLYLSESGAYDLVFTEKGLTLGNEAYEPSVLAENYIPGEGKSYTSVSEDQLPISVDEKGRLSVNGEEVLVIVSEDDENLYLFSYNETSYKLSWYMSIPGKLISLQWYDESGEPQFAYYYSELADVELPEELTDTWKGMDGKVLVIDAEGSVQLDGTAATFLMEADADQKIYFVAFGGEMTSMTYVASDDVVRIGSTNYLNSYHFTDGTPIEGTTPTFNYFGTWKPFLEGDIESIVIESAEKWDKITINGEVVDYYAGGTNVVITVGEKQYWLTNVMGMDHELTLQEVIKFDDPISGGVIEYGGVTTYFYREDQPLPVMPEELWNTTWKANGAADLEIDAEGAVKYGGVSYSLVVLSEVGENNTRDFTILSAEGEHGFTYFIDEGYMKTNDEYDNQLVYRQEAEYNIDDFADKEGKNFTPHALRGVWEYSEDGENPVGYISITSDEIVVIEYGLSSFRATLTEAVVMNENSVSVDVMGSNGVEATFVLTYDVDSRTLTLTDEAYATSLINGAVFTRVYQPEFVYTLTIEEVGGKGTISTEGETVTPPEEQYKENDVIALYITAPEGYKIKSVLLTADGGINESYVDGPAQDTVTISSLEFHADVKIVITYVAVYTIELSEESQAVAKLEFEGGNDVNYFENGTVKFKVTAKDPANIVVSVKVQGTDTAPELDADGYYTVTVNGANITLVVEVVKNIAAADGTKTYNGNFLELHVSADDLDWINKNVTSVKVNGVQYHHGGENKGYLIDGQNIQVQLANDEADSYKLEWYNAEGKLVAVTVYTQPENYTVTLEVTGEKNVEGNSATLNPEAGSIKRMTEVTLTVNVADGYKATVKVDGASVQLTDGKTYTFTLKKDTTITVEFSVKSTVDPEVTSVAGAILEGGGFYIIVNTKGMDENDIKTNLKVKPGEASEWAPLNVIATVVEGQYKLFFNQIVDLAAGNEYLLVMTAYQQEIRNLSTGAITNSIEQSGKTFTLVSKDNGLYLKVEAAPSEFKVEVQEEEQVEGCSYTLTKGDNETVDSGSTVAKDTELTLKLTLPKGYTATVTVNGAPQKAGGDNSYTIKVTAETQIVITYHAPGTEGEINIQNGGEDASKEAGWIYWKDDPVKETEVKLSEEDGNVTIHAVFNSQGSTSEWGFQIFYNDLVNYKVGNRYTITATIASKNGCTIVLCGKEVTLTANEPMSFSQTFDYDFHTENVTDYNYGISLFDLQVRLTANTDYDLTFANIKWEEAAAAQKGASVGTPSADKAIIQSGKNDPQKQTDGFMLWWVGGVNWNSGKVVTMETSIAEAYKDGKVAFSYKGGDVNFSVQLFYDNTSNLEKGKQYFLSLNVKSTQNITITVNGTAVTLTANEVKAVEVLFTNDSVYGVDIQFPGTEHAGLGANATIGIEVSDVEWYKVVGEKYDSDPAEKTMSFSKAELKLIDGVVYLVVKVDSTGYTADELATMKLFNDQTFLDCDTNKSQFLQNDQSEVWFALNSIKGKDDGSEEWFWTHIQINGVNFDSANGDLKPTDSVSEEVVSSDEVNYHLSLNGGPQLIVIAKNRPAATEPQYEATKVELTKDENKVYYVVSGTYKNYEKDAFEQLLNGLNFNLQHVPGAAGSTSGSGHYWVVTGFPKTVTVSEGTWEFKIEVTVGLSVMTQKDPAEAGDFGKGAYVVHIPTTGVANDDIKVKDATDGFTVECGEYKYQLVNKNGETDEKQYWGCVGLLIYGKDETVKRGEIDYNTIKLENVEGKPILTIGGTHENCTSKVDFVFDLELTKAVVYPCEVDLSQPGKFTATIDLSEVGPASRYIMHFKIGGAGNGNVANQDTDYNTVVSSVTIGTKTYSIVKEFIDWAPCLWGLKVEDSNAPALSNWAAELVQENGNVYLKLTATAERYDADLVKKLSFAGSDGGFTVNQDNIATLKGTTVTIMINVSDIAKKGSDYHNKWWRAYLTLDGNPIDNPNCATKTEKDLDVGGYKYELRYNNGLPYVNIQVGTSVGQETYSVKFSGGDDNSVTDLPGEETVAGGATLSLEGKTATKENYKFLYWYYVKGEGEEFKVENGFVPSDVAALDNDNDPTSVTLYPKFEHEVTGHQFPTDGGLCEVCGDVTGWSKKIEVGVQGDPKTTDNWITTRENGEGKAYDPADSEKFGAIVPGQKAVVIGKLSAATVQVNNSWLNMHGIVFGLGGIWLRGDRYIAPADAASMNWNTQASANWNGTDVDSGDFWSSLVALRADADLVLTYDWTSEDKIVITLVISGSNEDVYTQVYTISATDGNSLAEVYGIGIAPEYGYFNGTIYVIGDKDKVAAENCNPYVHVHSFDPASGKCTCGAVNPAHEHVYENGQCTLCGAVQKADLTGSGFTADSYSGTPVQFQPNMYGDNVLPELSKVGDRVIIIGSVKGNPAQVWSGFAWELTNLSDAYTDENKTVWTGRCDAYGWFFGTTFSAWTDAGWTDAGGLSAPSDEKILNKQNESIAVSDELLKATIADGTWRVEVVWTEARKVTVHVSCTANSGAYEGYTHMYTANLVVLDTVTVTKLGVHVGGDTCDNISVLGYKLISAN